MAAIRKDTEDLENLLYKDQRPDPCFPVIRAFIASACLLILHLVSPG